MKNSNSPRVFLCLLVLLSLALPVFAQRGRKPVIFAVLNNGANLEPIAYVEKGKLESAVDGAAEAAELTLFHKAYFKPKSSYRLIFGGANAGTATVVKSDASAECSKHMAQATVNSTKTKLGGFVMALATDATIKNAGSGVRRRPTVEERNQIEALVRAEFKNQKLSAAAIKTLKSQNLTALDVDNDQKADFVGSYWVATGSKERALLFFIAQKNSAGKYEFGYSSFGRIKQEDVMSEDLKTVDEGTLHEVLLDVFDYDDDGVSEIFTYSPSFEGASFYAYKRSRGKWEKAFETANYHCAY